MQMRYLHNVASLRIDAARCIGCDLCMRECPHDVIELRGRKAVMRDLDSCTECAAPAGKTALSGPWRLKLEWAAPTQ